MVQIIHRGQHLYRHKSQEVTYTTTADASVKNVKQALDSLYSTVGGLQWKDPVATKSALPLSGNTVNDARVVQDDGDGKAAIYVCTSTTGSTVDDQWTKIADVDWQGSETKALTSADSPYSVTTPYNTFLCDTSSGAITVNLPAGSSNQDKTITVKKTTNDTNQITISPNGSDTIDGDSSLVIGGYQASVTMVMNGTNWYII